MTKKFLSAAAAGLALLMLVACSQTPGLDPKTLEASSAGELGTEVTMHLSKEEYEAVPEELSLVITNRTGEEYSYGLDYWLEVQLDGSWYVLPPDEEPVFAALAVMLEPDGVNSETVALQQFWTDLPDGRYRVVKNFHGADGELSAAAEFTVG